jgi:TPR repeat protein
MRLLKCLPFLLCLCCAYAEEITKEDVERYRASAEQGDALAQFKLGSFYARGEGVPEDDVKAYMWLNLASAQGDEESKRLKAVLTERITREQIAEGQKMSREWLEKRENK